MNILLELSWRPEKSREMHLGLEAVAEVEGVTDVKCC